MDLSLQSIRNNESELVSVELKGEEEKEEKNKNQKTWARDTLMLYWSADTLFWKLSIDMNIQHKLYTLYSKLVSVIFHVR